MLGLVDTAIMGHLDSAAFIGAIAVGSTMFNLIYWLFGFLRMSTGGLTAQARGAGDSEAVAAVLERSLLIAAVGGAAVVALSPLLSTLLLRFIDAAPDVAAEARRYFMITVWGAPAVLAGYTFNGWYIGMHDTRTPMIVAIATNIFNIVVSATLVFGAGMTIAGVAIGTLAAQWLSAIALGWLAVKCYRPARVPLRILTSAAELRRLTAINVDIFLRTLCLAAVTLWFTRAGAQQDSITLSANALLMQLFMFFSYFSDGFAYAGEALAGEAAGSGDRQQLHAAVKALLRAGGVIAVVFSAAYFLAGDLFVGLLTDRGEVTARAAAYMGWAALVPLCGVTAFIYDGIFIGLTATRRMLVSIALASAAFFACYALAVPVMGNHGLWLAFVIYLAVRGVYLHWSISRVTL